MSRRVGRRSLRVSRDREAATTTMSDITESLQFGSLWVLYLGFQMCRHANPDSLTRAIPRLQSLHGTLAAVQYRDTFDITVDSAEIDERPEGVVQVGTSHTEVRSLSPTQRAALAFVQILVAELVRLAERGNTAALRGLGYQFHNFPAALRADRPYDRSTDSGSFRVAAAHWNQLSLEMRTAFCEYVGVDLSSAERLVRSNGFADTMDY
jgi:hypothetical protein